MRTKSSATSAQVFTEAAIAISLLGCIPVVIKYVAANAFTIGIFRLAVAVICVFVVLRKELRFSIPLKQWLILVGMGILFGLNWLTYFLSVKISSASTAQIGLSTYGVHLIILGWLFGKATATLIDLLAIIVAITGNLLVIPEFSLANNTTRGFLLSVISGFLYACLPILHQRYPHLSSSMRAFGQFLFGLAFFLLFLPLSDWHLRSQDWVGLLFLAVACTFVAHTLWVRVTTALSTSTASVIYYLSVPVALMLSYFVLREPIGYSTLAGAALIIAANLMGLHAQWKRKALMAKSVELQDLTS